MRRRFVPTIVSVAVGLAGCATESHNVASAYVSPLQYQSYDCEQMAAEGQRIQGRVIELGGRLDQAAKNDKALVGVGLVVFWPALLFIGGSKTQELEYGRLKGEYDALQQAAIGKKCQLAASGAPGAEPVLVVKRAEFKLTDGFTHSTRTVSVTAPDVARGAWPGSGDLDTLQPPGGWVPADAETRGRWTASYALSGGPNAGRADLSGQAGPRAVLGTPLGPRSVIPVTYEGWIARNVGYGDLIIEHKATIRIWYSPELRLPVKFESSVVAGGNYNRDSKETLLLSAVD